MKDSHLALLTVVCLVGLIFVAFTKPVMPPKTEVHLQTQLNRIML